MTAEEAATKIIPLATRRSQRIFRRRPGAPSVACFIDSFYFTLERWLHPRKEIIVRDFCYSVYDPRHWGRPMPGQLDRLARNSSHVWRARARFDFDAAAEGELSIRENEVLLILGDLGNGWLSARKHPSAVLAAASSLGSEAGEELEGGRDNNRTGKDGRDVEGTGGRVGLIPENYVERI